MNTLNDNRLTRRRTIFIVGAVFLAAWSGLTPTSRADTVTVKTEDELKQAIANQVNQIIVEGELAIKISQGKDALSTRSLPSSQSRLMTPSSVAGMTPATVGGSIAALSAIGMTPATIVGNTLMMGGSIISLIQSLFFLGEVAILKKNYNDYKLVDIELKEGKVILIRK